MGLRHIVSPFEEKAGFLIFITVKHIPGNQKGLWFKELHLRKQPLQVFFKNILRNADSGFSEVA